MEAKSNKKSKPTKKVTDAGTNMKGGRLEKFWDENGTRTFVLKLRKPAVDLSKLVDFKAPAASILKNYSISGLEFGNWVTNEDRINYLYGLAIALHDLNKVLNFKSNIGLNRSLAIAFGARGRGQALAHFEPGTDTINLTRYTKAADDQSKIQYFGITGGLGSLAHEYGHFLDYFFGGYIEQSKDFRSLTHGHTTTTDFNYSYRPGLRSKMRLVILNITYKSDGVLSDYYKGLKKRFGEAEYWFRHTELFARCFEQYISHKLQAKGIQNTFLSKAKYTGVAYMKPADFKRVLPFMDNLINEMSKKVRS